MKIVNTSAEFLNRIILLQTSGKVNSKAGQTVLSHDRLDAMNSIDNAEVIKPVDKEIMLKGKNIEVALAPYSFNIINVKLFAEQK